MKIRTYLLLAGIILIVRSVYGKTAVDDCLTFTLTYTSPCYNNPDNKNEVMGTFYAYSNGGIQDDITNGTFVWNFGDGTPTVSILGGNFQAHTYAIAGTYNVSLTYTPPAGSTCQHSFATYITATVFKNYLKLTSNYSSVLVNTPITITFSSYRASSSPFSGNSRLQINGEPSAINVYPVTSPYTFKPTVAGLHTVYLTVYGGEAFCTLLDSIKFNVISSCPPCSNVGISAPSPVCIGTGIQFVNNTNNCTGITNPLTDLEYGWDFGDGITGTGYRPMHTYTVAGTYKVKLNYSTTGNCPHTDSTTVIVQPCIEEPPCKDCIGSFAPPSGTYIVGTWVKQNGGENLLTYDKAAVRISCITPTQTIVSGTFYPNPSEKIIDGWQRIEQKFTVPPLTTQIQIQLLNTGATDVYFDDIRIHPVDGVMKSYVYDPLTLRLMAELDENNFATFYEYDEEGALIRVKKETERGIMTLKENRNNNSK